MNRVHALVLALSFTTLVGACDKKPKAKEAPPKATVTMPADNTPPVVAPPGTTTTPPTTPPTTTPTGDGIKIPMAERKVGTRWIKTDDLTSHMVLTAPGDKKVAIEGKRHYRDELEVVELGPDGVLTKVKASYPEREDGEIVAGKAKAKPIAIAGKSYIVWSKDGKVEATLADGGAVSPAELAELTDDLDELGKPRVMDRLMSARTWKIGEPYALTADELAQLAAIKSAKSPRQVGITLTLTSVDAGKAVFAMQTTMKVEGKAELEVAMTGKVTIDIATGRPLAVELSGPVKGSAGGMPLEGTMTGANTYAYPAS